MIFLKYILAEIVDYPEQIRIERSVDEMGVLLTVHGNKSDMGKIIGRSGQTAAALRVLLRIVGSKINARVNMKVAEPALVAA